MFCAVHGCQWVNKQERKKEKEKSKESEREVRRNRGRKKYEYNKKNCFFLERKLGMYWKALFRNSLFWSTLVLICKKSITIWLKLWISAFTHTHTHTRARLYIHIHTLPYTLIRKVSDNHHFYTFFRYSLLTTKACQLYRHMFLF